MEKHEAYEVEEPTLTEVLKVLEVPRFYRTVIDD